MKYQKKTDGKAGFYHLEDFSGDIEQVELTYLIRDLMSRISHKEKLLLKVRWKNLMLRKV